MNRRPGSVTGLKKTMIEILFRDDLYQLLDEALRDKNRKAAIKIIDEIIRRKNVEKKESISDEDK
jgi:hypothetical protein